MALIPAAILLVASLNLHMPYFSLAPGPAESLAARVQVEGAEIHPLNGDLLLTTVSLRSVRLADMLRGWMDRTIDVVHRDAIIPPGQTREEMDQLNRADMDQSQMFAAAAAFVVLGFEVQVHPAGVRVLHVQPDAPAATTLRPGDVILSADGQPIGDSRDLIERVEQRGVGEEISLRLRRGDEEMDATVATTVREEDPERPVIGIVIETIPNVELPYVVTIDAGTIGGPSAGLMFALTIVDLLGEEDLVRGRSIAGTGVIDPSGQIRPVGGIVQKVAAARRVGVDVFIAPTELLAAACVVAGDVRVIGVDDLRQAVDALRDEQAAVERSCP